MDNGLLSPSEVDARTLLDSFCSNGFSFLNTVGTYPAAERTAMIEALASFHNQGLFDEEGDLRHTMQNVAWSQRSLTEAGAGAWRELLERTGISPGGIGGSYSDLDEAILNSILDHRQNASAHKDNFYAAAYDVLDTRRSGNTCTVYLYIAFGSYDPTEEGYVLQTGGEDPAALTFATINGLYQLTEYWTPGGGAYYETDLRTVFPAEAAETRPGPHRLEGPLRPAGCRGRGAVPVAAGGDRLPRPGCPGGIHRPGAGHHARRDDL